MSKVSRQESFEEFQLTVLIKNSVLLCKTSVLNTTTVVKCTAKLYEVYVIYLILIKIFKVKAFNIFFFENWKKVWRKYVLIVVIYG